MYLHSKLHIFIVSVFQTWGTVLFGRSLWPAAPTELQDKLKKVVDAVQCSRECLHLEKQSIPTDTWQNTGGPVWQDSAVHLLYIWKKRRMQMSCFGHRRQVLWERSEGDHQSSGTATTSSICYIMLPSDPFPGNSITETLSRFHTLDAVEGCGQQGTDSLPV